ncbi:uncharacterized protein OCT59_002596 [Rhizophagus irregularis]|uniref:uncharacterized protein n=1 Tax=Rhizophagus irregularis TaxID=588596 RepID=UPI0033222713|nr:hypothetical protein OCT59_002596 [Rhizophagus irregularis]
MNKILDRADMFNIIRNFTINTKEKRTIHICRTGNENNWFTIILICTTDKTRLPLICIFKGKQMPHNKRLTGA